MPFREQEVKIPAVNYRGARKIGGAKTGGRSVERGTDIPKIERKIGNTPSRSGRSRAEWLPACHCRTVFIPLIQPPNVDFTAFYGIIYGVLSLICR